MQNEMNFGDRNARRELKVVSTGGAKLNPVQEKFNRVLKQLEKAKKSLKREENRLDRELDTVIRVVMPLVEELNQINRDMVFAGRGLLDGLKMTVRRREAFIDLLYGKAETLLMDPVGLSDEDIDRIEQLIGELEPEPGMGGGNLGEDEFELLREFIEHQAKTAGLDLDLSDLDRNASREDFERVLQERIKQAEESFGERLEAEPGPSRKRKPTKAQLAKEQRLREKEEAKKKDIKTLYKQLAKVLHPDLELDSVLRQHKELWMQRLTAAYAAGDLHQLLEIEMEWLGEEVGQLANASEQKLKVYMEVLKEQVEDLRIQKFNLRLQPQYGPLLRFEDPVTGYLPSAVLIEGELRVAVEDHRYMGEILTGSDAVARRKMINQWADAHARSLGHGF